MAEERADVVICGAGIAGIAAAWALTRRGVRNIAIVDERPPLTLTSDKSTECYRNWWPGPDDAMVRLMNRSIDLLEHLAHATGNSFGMNRRGYLYATASPQRIAELRTAAEQATAYGAGPLRIHDTPTSDYTPSPTHEYTGRLDGADLIIDPALIRRCFPYLNPRTVAVLHARRCGWLSAQQLGMLLLDEARANGARLVRGRVAAVERHNGAVAGVQLQGKAEMIATRCFVNAAGPLLREVGLMAGAELPVFSERHAKIAYEDRLGVVPRDAPMLIWADLVELAWNAEEHALLAADPATAHLTRALPPGVHTRPEGAGASNWALLLWGYDAAPTPERFPPEFPPEFFDVALRGMSAMLPGMEAYVERPPRPAIDGGYYTKTRENRPLIGRLPTPGAYVIGALSGYGIMAACAAGELLAAHVAGGRLPSYAAAFAPERYDDPHYRSRVEAWDDQGQL